MRASGYGADVDAEGQAPIVEVYADVWCPFAYVGLHEVLDARDALGASVPVVVRAWPLEKVNGSPLNAHDVLEEAAELRAQVAPELFRGVREESFPTTMLRALGLASAAYQAGLDVGERVSMALRYALFEDGADVSDRAVLGAIAADHGLRLPSDEEAETLVDAEYAAGRARSVLGSPHFFAGSADVFCPSLHLARDPSGLRAELDRHRLRSWLAEALS